MIKVYSGVFQNIAHQVRYQFISQGYYEHDIIFVFLWNIGSLLKEISSLMNFDLLGICITKYLLFIWIMFELGILILSSLLHLIYCYLLKPTLSTKHFLNSSRITNIKNVYVYLNCHSLSPWNNTQYFFSEYQCFVSMASPFK